MPQFTATHQVIPGLRLSFKWEGGPYIEVAEQGRRPIEVVNVWDYAADKATIPFTQPALSRAAKDWIEEYGRQELAHDVKENWYA